MSAEEFVFTKKNEKWAKEETLKYPEGREASASVALLWRAQEQSGGWLPESAIRYVAELVGTSPVRMMELATFYTMFNLESVGEFFVEVCGTTPCMLRGSEDIKRICKEEIGEEGEVGADGKFSWREVECLGACVNAPMVRIGSDYYEDLDEERLKGILATFRSGKKPRAGPREGRRSSEPYGGEGK